MNIGIYEIKNIKNNKSYIGSTKNLKRRLCEHRSKLRSNKHCNIKLQSAWNKYTSENFIFSIIEIVEDVEKLTEREQFYIDSFDCINNGYNLQPEAKRLLRLYSGPLSEEHKKAISNGVKNSQAYKEGRLKSNLGKSRKHSEESKLKMSLAIRKPKKPMSDEHRANLSKALKGRSFGPRSEETKKKLSIACRGWNHTEEAKKKISDASLAYSKKRRENKL